MYEVARNRLKERFDKLNGAPPGSFVGMPITMDLTKEELIGAIDMLFHSIQSGREDMDRERSMYNTFREARR